MSTTCDEGKPSREHLRMTINEDDLYGGILKLLAVIKPSWTPSSIKFKLFTDGITNKLVGCYINENYDDKDTILVRIYGNKTDLIIDRYAELRNMQLLHREGLAPKVYGSFDNGLAYEYHPGATLTPDTVLQNNIWPLVAKQMARMHKVQLGPEVPKKPCLWNKIAQFLKLLPEPFNDKNKQIRFQNTFGSVEALRKDYTKLKSHLHVSESPVVFAHNDLLLGNVIYDQVQETVSFIDYEYAAYNYQAFDIANHFNEFVGLSIDDIDYNKYPEKQFQITWLKVYLSKFMDNETFVTDEVLNKLYDEVQLMSMASHFLWGVWALVQYELSDINFDFCRYAEIRLQRYNQLKNKYLSE